MSIRCILLSDVYKLNKLSRGVKLMYIGAVVILQFVNVTGEWTPWRIEKKNGESGHEKLHHIETTTKPPYSDRRDSRKIARTNENNWFCQGLVKRFHSADPWKAGFVLKRCRDQPRRRVRNKTIQVSRNETGSLKKRMRSTISNNKIQALSEILCQCESKNNSIQETTTFGPLNIKIANVCWCCTTQQDRSTIGMINYIKVKTHLHEWMRVGMVQNVIIPKLLRERHFWLFRITETNNIERTMHSCNNDISG